ncbi:MAG TPA: phosphoribosylaminoimidazolesuccinocarboxamide synthase, partial [Candidatus Binataceae bacterium]|nr:phosphoribosylaminoimidazolesuccinocarboxamide synthase [Candidatus Binataceae bacterium]
NPSKLEQFYEGKAKKLYSTSDPDLVIAYFKDDATAFNAKKRGTIEDKGIVNNRMSELFFNLLERNGVPTHFVRRLDERQMLCKRLEIIPVELVVRNIVAGSMAKRLGREEGEVLKRPVIEYYYKSDPLDDPLINAEHALVFGWATPAELRTIDTLALKINDVLRSFLDERGIILVDFKLEFGRHHDTILLGDEICPDTCRFWDKATREKLDKDRFRRDLGNVEEAYQEMLRRVELPS